MRTAVVLLISLLLAGCGRGDGATARGPVGPVVMDAAEVATAGGVIRGVVDADHRVFQGIPYAAPPTGPLRWQLPAPAPAWAGVRDAAKPGPWCVQPDAAVEDRTAEDCLTLNVWTPTGRAPAARPVLVWIHGGSFMRGAGDIYDAHRLAEHGDIIVVTINYRLGALGFLADPALGEPGNYGLADQQAALRWVRDNIGNFGGDPTKVTIAGESAGGMSVCDHLVAPDSQGLFRAAIIQSGPCQAQVGRGEAQRISREYSAALGCGRREHAEGCLRALPAEKLATPLWYARFGTDQLSGPVIGTATLPRDPVAAAADGSAARVPVLIGTTRDEFTMFVALRYLREGREITAAEYPGVLADTFGARNAAEVLAHYPPARYGGSVSLAYAAAATDDIFACLADRVADGLARTSPGVYGYEFDDPHAPAPRLFDDVPFPVGATHSLELRYLFDIGGAPPLDGAQRALSEQMVDYWTRFVIAGAPDVAGQPDWPKLGADPGPDPAGDPWLVLRPDGSRVVRDFTADHQCGFWAGLRG